MKRLIIKQIKNIELKSKENNYKIGYCFCWLRIRNEV